jgi:hypothetical protein
MRIFNGGVCAGLVGLALAGAAAAGAPGGPVRRVSTVQGFHVRTFRLAFTPGTPAVVAVQGDGDTALSLVVLDALGRRVTAARSGDSPAARWAATDAGPYQVKVYNRGGVPNRFLLRTN